jgi:hypothetical protein
VLCRLCVKVTWYMSSERQFRWSVQIVALAVCPWSRGLCLWRQFRWRVTAPSVTTLKQETSNITFHVKSSCGSYIALTWPNFTVQQQYEQQHWTSFLSFPGCWVWTASGWQMCRFESRTWLMSRSLESAVIIVTNLQARQSEVRTPQEGKGIYINMNMF